ncbi:hypothetical protein [Mesobacillus harenae]|nr:hypothetical protein [Mesobacillus harenae]
MSRYAWITPEAKMRRKKRNQQFLYLSLILLTMILSALVTIMLSKF